MEAGLEWIINKKLGQTIDLLLLSVVRLIGKKHPF